MLHCISQNSDMKKERGIYIDLIWHTTIHVLNFFPIRLYFTDFYISQSSKNRKNIVTKEFWMSSHHLPVYQQ